MKLLIDTHILLWAANGDRRMSKVATALISDQENEPHFSAASIWEIVIKRGLGRNDFDCDPALLRRALLDNGWTELTITSAHALGVDTLPILHKDPFDRLLIAQAQCEGILLVTGDEKVAQYPGPIRLV